jgi:hypothetical protein
MLSARAGLSLLVYWATLITQIFHIIEPELDPALLHKALLHKAFIAQNFY